MIAHIKNIVKNAELRGYAIGAFNIHGLESVLGVARGAVKAQSPAIIQVSEGAVEYIGLQNLAYLVSVVAESTAKAVPIALHLDHGKNFDMVIACINAGFSSVHIDGSHLSLQENIELTKKVVSYAHKKKVWVQGEIGAIIGGHGSAGGVLKGIPIADADEVIQFVNETKVDTIAAAIGTAHGVYKNEDIIIPLLRKIKKETGKTFVLHGGSGVDDAKIKQAIRSGVNIINIGSDIKFAFSNTLKQTCKNNKKETDPRKLLGPSIDAIEKVVIEKMRLFGSFKKA